MLHLPPFFCLSWPISFLTILSRKRLSPTALRSVLCSSSVLELRGLPSLSRESPLLSTRSRYILTRLICSIRRIACSRFAKAFSLDMLSIIGSGGSVTSSSPGDIYIPVAADLVAPLWPEGNQTYPDWITNESSTFFSDLDLDSAQGLEQLFIPSWSTATHY